MSSIFSFSGDWGKIVSRSLKLKNGIVKGETDCDFYLVVRKIYFQRKCDFKAVFIVQLHLHCIGKPYDWLNNCGRRFKAVHSENHSPGAIPPPPPPPDTRCTHFIIFFFRFWLALSGLSSKQCWMCLFNSLFVSSRFMCSFVFSNATNFKITSMWCCLSRNSWLVCSRWAGHC